MEYNFHTHTSRCGHAYGTMREYIEAAIKGGVKRMGFSDHAPMPSMPETSWRISPSDTEDYVAEARALREEFKERITLYVGFEMEYYPTHFAEMRDFAIAKGAEYLILGQHFTFNEDARAVHSYRGSEEYEQLRSYSDALVAGMESGVFTYVAHPDVFHFRGDASLYQKEMERVCITSKQTGIPLEINLLGIRDGRHYPMDSFWQIAGRVGSPVCFGFDAHDPAAAADLASIPVAEALVNRYGLRYIEPSLRLLQK